MKTLLSVFFVISCSISGIAEDSAQLAADLQSADPAHWPAIEVLLKAQRAELNAAHLATLTTAAAESKAKTDDLAAQLITAKQEAQQALAAKTAAETELAANIERQAQLVTAAKQALSSGTTSAKLAAVSAVLVGAQKSTDDRKREALQKELDEAAAALAAKQAELNALK